MIGSSTKAKFREKFRELKDYIFFIFAEKLSLIADE